MNTIELVRPIINFFIGLCFLFFVFIKILILGPKFIARGV